MNYSEGQEKSDDLVIAHKAQIVARFVSTYRYDYHKYTMIYHVSIFLFWNWVIQSNSHLTLALTVIRYYVENKHHYKILLLKIQMIHCIPKTEQFVVTLQQSFYLI